MAAVDVPVEAVPLQDPLLPAKANLPPRAMMHKGEGVPLSSRFTQLLHFFSSLCFSFVPNKPVPLLRLYRSC